MGNELERISHIGKMGGNTIWNGFRKKKYNINIDGYYSISEIDENIYKKSKNEFDKDNEFKEKQYHLEVIKLLQNSDSGKVNSIFIDITNKENRKIYMIY